MANNRKRDPNIGDRYQKWMRSNVFGIPEDLISSIGKRLEIYELGLARDGVPLGAFLLTGDPGIGKTLTGETTAEFLHGNPKAVIHIAGEHFSREHEVAKMVGAPPGYLGHRETTPLITQTKLNAVTSEASGISIIVMDEIDKAHPKMSEMWLDALQKARWSLGDNSTVSFQRSLLFFTANWGSERRAREERWGFVKRESETATNTDIRNGVHPAFLDRIKTTGGIHEFGKITEEIKRNIIVKTLRENARFIKDRIGLKVELYLVPELITECLTKESGRGVAGHVNDLITSMLINTSALAEFVNVDARDETLPLFVTSSMGVKVMRAKVAKTVGN